MSEIFDKILNDAPQEMRDQVIAYGEYLLSDRKRCQLFHLWLIKNYWQTFGTYKEKTGGSWRKRSKSALQDPTPYTLDDIYDEFLTLTEDEIRNAPLQPE